MNEMPWGGGGKGLLSAFGETAVLMQGAAAVRANKMAAAATNDYKAKTVRECSYL